VSALVNDMQKLKQLRVCVQGRNKDLIRERRLLAYWFQKLHSEVQKRIYSGRSEYRFGWGRISCGDTRAPSAPPRVHHHPRYSTPARCSRSPLVLGGGTLIYCLRKGAIKEKEYSPSNPLNAPSLQSLPISKEHSPEIR